MIPLEIDRPWIREGAGKKTFLGVVVVVFVTFLLIFSFNGIFGTTVNIEQVNVSFNKINEPSFSIAYGKFTYSGSSTVTLYISVSISNGAHFIINSVSTDNGFNARLVSTVSVNGNGIYQVPVSVTMPSHNYAGALNITFS
ncbi:MAG: hypothetical protein M1375_03440 [Candidatus Thermoplasmatota archaeon]|nr:hypothetical protein [Candidatus Thermoplasmatota archaeon]MCL5791006.1 hypothetical protein [Candidatus Thermoplasmatota archaeon]